jgi:N-hydroxyarylamine O-acetyltransferase
MSSVNLDHYFQRIGHEAPARADLATLQTLHRLHPQAIAFENLDSWLGQPVLLEPTLVQHKLVQKGRGGYCFEQNLLFMQVLQSLGFEVRGLAARVLWNLPSEIVLPRTHMLLLVTIGGVRHIADVGFGGLTMTAALELETDSVQQSPHEAFRLRRDRESYVLQACVAGHWQPLYNFSLDEQQPADYAMANWYVSRHPESRFISQLIAGRAAAGMRHALLDNRYTRHYPDRPSEQQSLQSPAEIRRVLEQELLISTAGLPGLDARLTSLFEGN